MKVNNHFNHRGLNAPNELAPLEDKKALQKEIDEQVKKYLESGGVIQQIEFGYTEQVFEYDFGSVKQ